MFKKIIQTVITELARFAIYAIMMALMFSSPTDKQRPRNKANTPRIKVTYVGAL
jgi:hypothetical protein